MIFNTMRSCEILGNKIMKWIESDKERHKKYNEYCERLTNQEDPYFRT